MPKGTVDRISHCRGILPVKAARDKTGPSTKPLALLLKGACTIDRLCEISTTSSPGDGLRLNASRRVTGELGMGYHREARHSLPVRPANRLQMSVHLPEGRLPWTPIARTAKPSL